MAVLALAGLGAAAGGLLTGGAAFGIQAGFLAGQLAARAFGFGVDKNNPGKLEPATEFRVSSSSYGATFKKLDGTKRIDGQLTDILDLRSEEVTEEVKGKGKSQEVVVGFKYFSTFEITFTEAAPGGDTILKIMVGADQKVVFDRTAAGPIFLRSGDIPGLFIFAVAVIEAGGGDLGGVINGGGLRIYPGSMTQAVDSLKQSKHGADNTPADLGLCKVIFDDIELDGPVIPAVSAVITSNASDNYQIDTLTPSGATNAAGVMTLPGGRQFVSVNTLGEVCLFDAVNRAELYCMTAQPEVTSGRETWGGSYGLGPDGALYLNHGYATLFDTDGRIQKYSLAGGLSLAWVTPSTLTGGDLQPNDIAVSGNVVFADGAAAGHIGTCDAATGQTVTTYTVGGVVDTVHVPFAVIGDGTVWAAFSDGSDPVLVHLGRYGELGAVTLTGVAAASGLTYVPEVNALVFWNGTDGKLQRFSLETASIDGEIVLDFFAGLSGAGGIDNRYAFKRGPIAGRLWLNASAPGTAGDVVEVDLIAMTVVRELDLPGSWGGTANGIGFYDPLNHALVSSFGGPSSFTWEWRFLDRKTGGATTIQAIHERHAPDVGLSVAEDLEVSAGADLFVDGHEIPQHGPLRQWLEPLQVPWSYNLAEEFNTTDGYRIRLKKRGSAPVVSIPIAELGARPGGRPAIPAIAFDNSDPLELPRAVELGFRDAARDYDKNIVNDQREPEVVDSEEIRQLNFDNVAMTPAFARQAIEKILVESYVGNTTLSLAATRKYARIRPADVIEVVDDVKGITYRILIVQTTATAEGVILWRGVTEDLDTFTPSAVAGETGEGVTPATIEILGLATAFPLDLPLLVDEIPDDLVLTFGAGVLSAAETFPGAAILRSPAGVTFSNWNFIPASARLRHGFALEALPAWSDFGTADRINTLKFRLFDEPAALASITEADLMADLTLNAFILQNGDGWEIGNAVDVTQLADGSFEATTLLRGRRNTENHTGAHAVGDTIIWPTPGMLRAFEIQAGELGQTRYFKAVSLGTLARDAVAVSLGLVGRSAMPYSPHALGWSESAGDYTVSFSRRTRRYGLPSDLGAVPLEEASEDYECDVLDGMGGVAFTITTSASANGSVISVGGKTVTIDALDLSGAGVAAPFSIALYQLGAQGRGEPATFTVG